MLLRYKAYYKPITRPSEVFSVEFEYDLPVLSIDEALVQNIADDIVGGLVLLLTDEARMDRVVASTYEPDGDPYDPSTFRVFSYADVGTRTGIIGIGTSADTIVLLIRRVANQGRFGRIFLRLATFTNEIAEEDGELALTTDAFSAISTLLASAFTSWTANGSLVMIGNPLVDTIYPATAEGEKQVPIKVYAPDPVVRAVTSMPLVGVTNRQKEQ